MPEGEDVKIEPARFIKKKKGGCQKRKWGTGLHNLAALEQPPRRSLFNYNDILSIMPHCLSTVICLPPIAGFRRQLPGREPQTGRYVLLSLIRLRVLPTYGQLEQTIRQHVYFLSPEQWSCVQTPEVR